MARRLALLSLILDHPLNRRHRVRALARWFAWQGWKVIVRRPITIKFWRELRVRVYPDWPYSWTAIYLGLTEYDDMMFTLRYLRPGDTFVDVGANIGFYSFLAASVNGAAPVLAYEPHPTASERLRENIAINSFDNVRVRQVAVGDIPDEGRLSTDLMDQNRLESTHESFQNAVVVPIVTLDADLTEQGVDLATIRLVKIDTEGFEAKVIAGAQSLLDADPGPVWLVELTWLGRRYGSDAAAMHRFFTDRGYRALRYLAAENRLFPYDGPDPEHENVIFARQPDQLALRLESALAG